MANLQTMYPGVANSPDTFLVEGLTIDGTVMYVADGAVFGEIPTLAVIGQTELAETVQITGKQPDGGYTIIRGVEGKRQAWAKATNVARNWTNKDYEALRANITAINDGKVDKVAGKGLSTHDYDAAAKAKVDAIPPDPKYTDTVPDLTPYAKATDLSTEREERKADISRLENTQIAATQSVRADIKTRLADMQEDSEHRTVTDAEKKAWDGKVDKVNGKGLSTNDYSDTAKAKVDAIPTDPKYTDTIPDLSPYAKKTDIKTSLADMVEDSEHRTVTDDEKKAWSKGGGIDKQYLYDILMGESLVTRKKGELPVVHGKPTSIGDKAFISSRLTGVIIPPRVTSIGDKAFYNNKLTIVIIPPSVTSIGNYAFYGNQLTSVVIPSSVTSIGRSAFAGGRLTSVVIPPHVKNIEQEAFYGNALTSVVIPPSVTSIGSEAFRSNYFTEVKVPKNCTVASDAFDSDVNIIRY